MSRQPRRRTPANPGETTTHNMVVVTHAGDGPVFKGRIDAGTGAHDYHCGRCHSVILRHVARRFASAAVYECRVCHALNAVGEQNPAGRSRDEVRNVHS